MINATVPADPRLRKRAIAFVSITLLVGLVFLYFFQGFLREMEALATASPQLAFEKLNPVRNAARGLTLFSATALACLLGYVAFSVHRAGQWPPPGWRVIYTMSIRTGRQATVVALLFGAGARGSHVWVDHCESVGAGAYRGRGSADGEGVGVRY